MNFEKVVMGNATLYRGDCMEFLAKCKDKEYDLAVVDPPYGIGMDGGKFGIDGKSKAQEYVKLSWDKTTPPKEYFLDLSRVSNNQIVWGANHFANLLPNPQSPCWLVWDKEKVGGFFADSELAYTSFTTSVRNFKFQWHGMLQGDMKNKEQRIHPTQKPVALYEWILTNYAKQGQTILDTHLGSGSSAIAAHNLGFEFTGIELDKDYFDAAVKRLERHVSQARLFEPETVKQEQTALL